MKMHNPPRPGQVLRVLYLAPLDLTITAAAEGLGVAHKGLSEVVIRTHGHFARHGDPAGEGVSEHGYPYVA